MATIVTQKECPSCGAPLSVDGTATSVRCTYCGTTVQIERGRAPRARDPASPPATAVCGKHNGRISGRGGSIDGAIALHFERAPDEQFFGTTITGARRVDALGRGALPSLEPVMPPPRKSPTGTVHTPGPTPPAPVPGPAFDAAAAVIALDAATRAASAQCHSSSGRRETIFVSAAFAPDGRNSGASVGGALRGTAEGSCVERVFRGVNIRPFDPAIRPSGLGRSVELK